MAKNRLTIRYDGIGDILYIDKRPPYAEQVSRQLDDEIVARYNPETDDVETVEVLFFTKRLFENNILELPISFEAKLAV